MKDNHLEVSKDSQMVFNLLRNDVYSVDWVHSAKYTKDWNIKSEKFLPSHSYIKDRFDYDDKTGNLIHKKLLNSKHVKLYHRFNKMYSGKIAGKSQKGRFLIGLQFNGKYCTFLRSRTVWCWHNGRWPDPNLLIDHINGNPSDDRIENLKEVTRIENARNMKRFASNKSGHQGVYQIKKEKWQAYITVNQKQIHLGFFKKKEDAIVARKEAETKYGFHENHGRDGTIDG